MTTEVEKPLSEETIRRALGDFQITVSDEQVHYIQRYIAMLRHWNEKLNLTL
jgi:16S rRNA G527 N7-methylase RsmG